MVRPRPNRALAAVTRFMPAAMAFGCVLAVVGAASAQPPDKPERADVLHALQALTVELRSAQAAPIAEIARARATLAWAFLEAQAVDDAAAVAPDDPSIRAWVAFRRRDRDGLREAIRTLKAANDYGALAKVSRGMLDELIVGERIDAALATAADLIPRDAPAGVDVAAVSFVFARAIAAGRLDFAARVIERAPAEERGYNSQPARLLRLALAFVARDDHDSAIATAARIEPGRSRRDAMLRVAAALFDRGANQTALSLISDIEADRRLGALLLDQPGVTWPVEFRGLSPFNDASAQRLRGEAIDAGFHHHTGQTCVQLDGAPGGPYVASEIPPPLIAVLALLLIRAGDAVRARPYVDRLERYVLKEMAGTHIDDLPHLSIRIGDDERSVDGLNRQARTEAERARERESRLRKTLAECWIARVIGLRLVLADYDRIPGLLAALREVNGFATAHAITVAESLARLGQGERARSTLAEIKGRSWQIEQHLRVVTAYGAGRTHELTAEIEQSKCRSEVLRPLVALIRRELNGRQAEAARASLSAIEALERRRPELFPVQWLVVFAALHLDAGAREDATRAMARLLERARPSPGSPRSSYSTDCADTITWLEPDKVTRLFVRFGPIDEFVPWFERSIERQDRAHADWRPDLRQYAYWLAMWGDANRALVVYTLATRSAPAHPRGAIQPYSAEAALAPALGGAGRLAEAWAIVDRVGDGPTAIELKARAALMWLRGRNTEARDPAASSHRIQLP